MGTRLHRLPALPETIPDLKNDDFERLVALNPSLYPGPRINPQSCITCGGSGTFRWWSYATPTWKPGDSIDPVEYECPCLDQWVLHTYLLHCGVGRGYQRMSWHDDNTEPGAGDVVRDYILDADRVVRTGLGLTLHGPMGTGKTMLSALAVKAFVGMGHDCYMTSFVELTNTFASAWKDKEERLWFYRRIKNSTVLVVDDIGREPKSRRMVKGEDKTGMIDHATTVSESSIDEVLRHRLANDKPTIITTNFDIERMTEMYGRNILSLLSERSLVFRFSGSDYRHKLAHRDSNESKLRLTRPVVLA